MRRLKNVQADPRHGRARSPTRATALAFAIAAAALMFSAHSNPVAAQDFQALTADDGGNSALGQRGTGNKSGHAPAQPGAGTNSGDKAPSAGTENKNPRGGSQGPGCPFSNQQLELIV